MKTILIRDLEVERLMQENQEFWACLICKMSVRSACTLGPLLRDNKTTNKYFTHYCYCKKGQFYVESSDYDYLTAKRKL